MSTATPSPTAGLAGVIAGQTSICSVEQGALIYRGFEIHDLAENASFEEVAHLLLVGHKANPSELASFKDELIANRALPPVVIDYLKTTASMFADNTTVPMDVLRTCVSILGNLDADSQDNSPEAELRKAKRLTAKIPTIIGHMQTVIDNKPLVAPETGGDAKLSHAANLLYLMTGEKPEDKLTHTMDVSLILYAEHDYNASTFASRVIAGTLSDMHGAVTGAIAALKGPLHGGANEAAMDMLKEILEHLDAGGTVQSFMDNAFTEKRKLMGFGHRVYKNGDHRAPILHALGKAMAQSRGEEFVRLFKVGEEVQQIMDDQKNIKPNVDFPCGMAYYTMGIPVPQYTPIFVASRITGWCAHIMEQHQNNRLIRPIAEYVGPPESKWNG